MSDAPGQQHTAQASRGYNSMGLLVDLVDVQTELRLLCSAQCCLEGRQRMRAPLFAVFTAQLRAPEAAGHRPWPHYPHTLTLPILPLLLLLLLLLR